MPVRAMFEWDTVYYVTNTGGERVLWKEQQDFDRFLKTVSSYLAEYDHIEVLAYSVLPNDYHFVLKNSHEGMFISDFLRKLQISYAMYFKKKYPQDLPKWVSLFADRFVAEKMLDSAHQQRTEQKVHLNPMYYEIVERLADWPYTSAHQVANTGYRSKGETHISIAKDISPELLEKFKHQRREDFLEF